MIATVHIADVGVRAALGVVRAAPKPGSQRGLRNAHVALAAPLSRAPLARPQVGRAALLAFWDDDAAVDDFLAGHPLAETLAAGWRARLAPLRAFGAWPGVPPDVPTARNVDHDGAAVVLTLGRLRLSQTVRFLRASARAEGSANESPGMLWATGMARPPFVATCSLWDSTRSLSTYAYGQRDPGHPDAIAAHAEKPFHSQSAFIRFRPYDVHGSLSGRNPLPAAAVVQSE